jgi:two-component system, response regulator FlrC
MTESAGRVLAFLPSDSPSGGDGDAAGAGGAGGAGAGGGSAGGAGGAGAGAGGARTAGNAGGPGDPAVTAVRSVLGDRVHLCPDIGGFLRALREGNWSATLLRLDREPVDDRLAERVAAEPRCGVLILTSGDAGVEAVLRAESVGAAALLPHPPTSELLRRELLPLVEEGPGRPIPPAAPADGEQVIGTDPAMIEVFRTVAKVASAPATVLVTGESGTGKELVARALHRSGVRAAQPFVALNCAALPDTLLEAELFGHERGAFTGAVGRSEGRFGRAHRGTLFLDEVGEMSLPLQAKLLRVLETGEVERLGASETQRVDVRIVAATNRDLAAEVEAGRFREDLLYRLTVVEVELPPLRERQGDLVPLALHFVQLFSERHGKAVRALSPQAEERLLQHDWPGNVRELRNVLDRAVLLARGGVIRSGDLRLGRDSPRTSPREAGDPGSAEPGYPPTWSMAQVEEAHLRAVLTHTGGHMREAAEILGLHRNTVTGKVRDYGIDVEAKRPDGTLHARSEG